MDIEEEIKPKIFNNVNPEIKEKKKYFRVEKRKFNHLEQSHKDSKQIFKTQKDYHQSKAKAVKEFKRIKANKNNKFITTMNLNSSE